MKLDKYIKRIYEPKDISMVLDSPILENEIPSITNNSSLNTFVNTLESNLSKEELQHLYHNLKTLKIRYGSGIENYLSYYMGRSAKYEVFYNKVTVYDNRPNVLSHELLHMSSSLNTPESFYSGFIMGSKTNKYSLGEGLTEGMTEVINRDYFLSNTRVSPAYYLLMEIIRLLSNIIDYETLINIYFTADLKRLITLLTNYASLNEVMLFIRNTDFILKCERYKNHPKCQDLYQESINDINKFLITLHKNINNSMDIENTFKSFDMMKLLL